MQSAYKDCCSVVLDKFLHHIKHVAKASYSTDADVRQINLAIESLQRVCNVDKEEVRKVILSQQDPLIYI